MLIRRLQKFFSKDREDLLVVPEADPVDVADAEMPFQLVNDSTIETIVGIQIKVTCRMVGIPAIAIATQRSRPSN